MKNAEYRQKYKEYLEGSVRNQKMVLEGTRNFEQTGQPTQPVDVRTITEKIADMEASGGLRDLLREQLLKIIEPSAIYDVISELDTDQIKFMLIQFPTIEQDMFKHYGGKVPTARIFLNYFEKYMSEFEKTQGVHMSITPEELETVSRNIGQKTKLLKGDDIPYKVAKKKASGVYTSDFDMDDSPIFAGENQITTFDDLSESISLLENKNTVLDIWYRALEEIKRQFEDEKNLTQDQLDGRRDLLSTLSDPQLPKSRDGLGAKSLDDDAIFQAIHEWADIYYDNNIGAYKARNGDYNYMFYCIDEDAFGGLQGSGIRKKIQGRGIKQEEPKKEIPKKGIQKKDAYVDFGNYIIHTSKLDDGILVVKTKSKTKISDIPQKKLSQNLSNIFHTIVGGSTDINPDDMTRLTNEEKTFLDKVIRRAKLSNQVRIPLPEKDEKQREDERFELLRGQVLSGNDSSELIAEFKKLLLKLKREKRLPKNEVDDILYELLILGY